MPYGTLSTQDTLATLTAASNVSVAQFGEDRAFAAIDAALAAHNALFRDMTADLLERTTDTLRRYGGSDTMDFQELDQWGTPDAQKVTAGVNVGFPLRLYGLAVQWTRKYFLVATPQEVAAQFVAAQDGDLRNFALQLKRAIFTPTNTTFVDRLVNSLSLPVKAFLNADGAAVPVGPNGETFNGSTHTHYLYTAGTSLVQADVTALLNTIVEHYAQGEAMLYINQAQEAAIRALAGFTPYIDARIQPAVTTQYARGELVQTQIYNRAIGVLNQAEVWIKPWVPAGYLFAFIQGGPPPLVMRTRMAAGGDLELVYEAEEHPLRARGLEREFGIGVWNRANGAVLYIDSGSAGAYVAPTVTASFNAA